MSEITQTQDLEVIFLLEKMIGELGGIYACSGKEDIQIIRQVQSYLIKDKRNNTYIETPLTEAQLELLVGNERTKTIAQEIIRFKANFNREMSKFSEKLTILSMEDEAISKNKESIRANFFGQYLGQINKLNIGHFQTMLSSSQPTLDSYLTNIEQYMDLMNNTNLIRVKNSVDNWNKNKVGNRVLTPEGKSLHEKDMEARTQGMIDFTRDVILDSIDFYTGMDPKTMGIQSKDDIQANRLAYDINYLLYRTKMIDRINDLTIAKKGVPQIVTKRVRWNVEYKDDPKVVKENENMKKEAKRDISRIIKEYQESVKSLRKRLKKDNKKGKPEQNLLGPADENTIKTDNKKPDFRDEISLYDNKEYKMSPAVLNFYDSLFKNPNMLQKFSEGKLKIKLSDEDKAILQKMEQRNSFSSRIARIQQHTRKKAESVKGFSETNTGQKGEKFLSPEFKKLEIKSIDSTRKIGELLHSMYTQYSINSMTYSWLLNYIEEHEENLIIDIEEIQSGFIMPASAMIGALQTPTKNDENMTFSFLNQDIQSSTVRDSKKIGQLNTELINERQKYASAISEMGILRDERIGEVREKSAANQSRLIARDADMISQLIKEGVIPDIKNKRGDSPSAPGENR